MLVAATVVVKVSLKVTKAVGSALLLAVPCAPIHPILIFTFMTPLHDGMLTSVCSQSSMAALALHVWPASS